jgi:hypothetical protein
MSLAQPRSARTGSQARIRILGDPPPTTPGRPSRGALLIACLLAAVIGAGLALVVRHWPTPGSVAVDPPSLGIGVAGRVDRTPVIGSTPQVPGPGLASALESVVLTGSHRRLPAAARLAAASREPAEPPPARSAVPVGSTAAETPSSITNAPVVASDGGQAPQADRPTIGPELPPNPVNPNSQIGSP